MLKGQRFGILYILYEFLKDDDQLLEDNKLLHIYKLLISTINTKGWNNKNMLVILVT